MRLQRTSAASLLLLCFAILTPRIPATPPLCSCTEAQRVDGWCELHQVGFVASIRIPSRLVFEALDAHGHTLPLGSFVCLTCKTAIATDGFCEFDSIGFVNQLAYFSRLTYELARGERAPRTGIKCRTCRKNSESQGWCAHCKTGRIGAVVIRDREAYERAAHAADILRAANAVAARCEWCGVALLTNTECPVCRIQYKGGKPVPPSQKPTSK